MVEQSTTSALPFSALGSDDLGIDLRDLGAGRQHGHDDRRALHRLRGRAGGLAPGRSRASQRLGRQVESHHLLSGPGKARRHAEAHRPHTQKRDVAHART